MKRYATALALAMFTAYAVACIITPVQDPAARDHRRPGNPPPPGTDPSGATYGGATYGGATYGGATYGGATYGGATYGGVRVTEHVIKDDSGMDIRIVEGPQGHPETIGCADGQREAFANHVQFPSVAGCLASWDGPQSLRAPTTATGCGDDSGPCVVPADACAPGWHVCGDAGRVAEVRAIGPDACATAGGGRFSAAISHCATQSGCQYDQSAAADYACFDRGWCSEAVCCGSDCNQFGACKDGVWPQATRIAQGTDQGCGAIRSQRAGGVLCCR